MRHVLLDFIEAEAHLHEARSAKDNRPRNLTTGMNGRAALALGRA